MYRTVGEIKHNGIIYPPGSEFPDGVATAEQIRVLLSVNALRVAQDPPTGLGAVEKGDDISAVPPYPLSPPKRKGGRR